MKKWIALSAVALGILPVLAAEQNPPQPPAPPQNSAQSQGPVGAMQPDNGRRNQRGEMRGYMMHDGGPGESGRILPPGAWWNDPDLAKRIDLTADQHKRIEDIFLQSKIALIHMHASLDEEELLLGPMLDANPVDQAKTLAQISKIADTRADLEKANAKMLLQIRGALSQQQWTKLQQERGGPMHPHGMMPRGPDGMHSMDLVGPDLQRLQDQLRAMRPIDTVKVQAQLQATLRNMPKIDAEALRAQVDAAVKTMPKIDPEQLRAQVDAAMKNMPRLDPEQLRKELQSMPATPAMPVTPNVPLPESTQP